jgi:hypothetical protein
METHELLNYQFEEINYKNVCGPCFHRIEDHGVTLLTVASRKGDLVSIKYISSFLWISEIYIAHKKQESGELFHLQYGVNPHHKSDLRVAHETTVYTTRYLFVKLN